MEKLKLEERQMGNLQCQGWEGPCENTNAVKYHMNTKYEDEESNYTVLCPQCQEWCDEYWYDMWKEVYSGMF